MVSEPFWTTYPLKPSRWSDNPVLAYHGSLRVVQIMRPLVDLLRPLLDKLYPPAVLLDVRHPVRA